MLFGGDTEALAAYAKGRADAENDATIGRIAARLFGPRTRPPAPTQAQQPEVHAVAAENAELRRELAATKRELHIWQVNYGTLNEWAQAAANTMREHGILPS